MAEILVVSMGGEGSAGMVNLLRGAGYTVVGALGFKQAGEVLAVRSPDLMIAAIRLGEYNGLHLVLRSQATHPTLRSILLDHAYDPLTETEANRYGARYLVEPVEGGSLLAQVSLALTMGTAARRWPRKRAAFGLLAEIEHQPGRVIDLSYGGLRFELPQVGEVPAHFDVTLPGVGLVFQAKPIWTRVQSGGLSCGAELLNPNPQAADSWRRFVDAIPDQP